MMVMIIRSGDDNDSCNCNSIYVMRINQTALHLKRWLGCKVGMCLPVVGLSVGRGVWKGWGERSHMGEWAQYGWQVTGLTFK